MAAEMFVHLFYWSVYATSIIAKILLEQDNKNTR